MQASRSELSIEDNCQQDGEGLPNHVFLIAMSRRPHSTPIFASAAPPVAFRLQAIDGTGGRDETTRRVPRASFSCRARRADHDRAAEKREAWLRLHALDLIERLSDWSLELDRREAVLNARESELRLDFRRQQQLRSRL